VKSQGQFQPILAGKVPSWGSLGQPRMILLLSHQYLGCDWCMNMYQTETLQIRRKTTYSIINVHMNKNRGTHLSHRFTFVKFKLGMSFDFEAKTLNCYSMNVMLI
jgi:hypothetical protein